METFQITKNKQMIKILIIFSFLFFNLAIDSYSQKITFKDLKGACWNTPDNQGDPAQFFFFFTDTLEIIDNTSKSLCTFKLSNYNHEKIITIKLTLRDTPRVITAYLRKVNDLEIKAQTFEIARCFYISNRMWQRRH
jgi:hypothetical protein